MRRGVAAAAAVVLAGTLAACGSSSGSKSGSGAQTIHILVDGHNPSVNEAFEAYFPKQVQAHPGDTLSFYWAGNGEPHTVTFGTLVNAALRADLALGPNYNGPPPPADQRVPQLLPRGPGDAVQDGANPCYVAHGVPPANGPCPQKAAQPDFDGTQAYYNSGWLNSKSTFTMHLSPGIKPGVYSFFCLLHRPGMSGSVTVVAKSTAIPSAAQQEAAGRAELAALESKLAPVAQALGQARVPGFPPVFRPGQTGVLAGSGSPAVNDGAITQFGPQSVHIRVGGSVYWLLIGVHTLVFGAPPNLDPRVVAPDGSVHLNMKAGAPAGGSPGMPANPGSGLITMVNGGSLSGPSFYNSGVLVSFPPHLIMWKLTFRTAGTYDFVCTLHDGMKGTVTVS